MGLLLLGACSSNKADGNDSSVTEVSNSNSEVLSRPKFNADSAYQYVEKMVSFGPRVPNTDAHRKGGDFIVKTLKESGWAVTEQKDVIHTFDGTKLNMRNIFAQINPDDSVRLLLITHWDCRPWADKDPDTAKRKEAVPGANDGASGVGVLLEIARQLSAQKPNMGVDLLFLDAEDWGSEDDEDSWALGAQYFTSHLPYTGTLPQQAILLDMVGSNNAQFGFEYFSEQANINLLNQLWDNASNLGYGKYFHKGYGGAATDDHIWFNKIGIPTIDIIDFRTGEYETGFDPVWHTTKDDMNNISKQTLRAVGETVLTAVK